MATFLKRLVPAGSERQSARSAVVFAILAFLVISGCGRKLPTFEEMREINRQEMALVLAKHGDAAKAKIEVLKAVATDAQAAPPLKAHLPVAALAAVDKNNPLKAGLLVVTPGWTGAPDVRASPIEVESDLRLGGIIGAMKNGHVYNTRETVDGIDRNLGLLTGLRYAGMVRVRQYDPPKAAMFGKERRFAAGRAAGDVLVYDLETKAMIGGFPFEIVQGNKAHVVAKTEEAIQRDLEASFTSNFNSSIREELKAFIDGKPGSASPGVEDRKALEQFVHRIELDVSLAHMMAGVKKAEITSAGGMTVTLHAEEPLILGGKNGVANPNVKAMVEKVLGCEAVVKVVKQ